MFLAADAKILLDQFNSGIIRNIAIVVIAVDAMERGEGAHVVAQLVMG